MSAIIKDFELKYGDLKDSISMYGTYQSEQLKKETRDYILFKAVKLIVELLLHIIKHH